MRITFLVNYDLASLLALNYLIPGLKQHQSTVLFTQKVANTKNVHLAALAKHDQDCVKGSPLISFEEFGGKRLNNINTTDYQQFSDSEPEVVVSIRHMSILKSTVINTPPLGIINLHSGVLPAYQGVMATFWALSHQEQQIGTTLHRIEDSSIDTGAIISQSSTPVNLEKSYLWNVLNIYKAGCQNVLDSITCFEGGNLPPATPQVGAANYYSYPTAHEVIQSNFALYDDSDNAHHFT
jgi:methionyl-tRNA formyltransferase